MENNTQIDRKQNIGDHLANERTFLAWVRTSVAIMGFGFVVVKFSLFVKQITMALSGKAVPDTQGYSHNIGILMVALGGLTIVAAFIRYNNTKKQLDDGSFHHTTLFIKVTTVVMILASIVLLVYLMKTT